MPTILDELSIGIEATLFEQLSDPNDILRGLDVSIVSYVAPESTQKIGTLTGWVGRGVGFVDPDVVWEATDGISTDSEALGAAAQQILTVSERFGDVLLVDRITLDERYRGQKLMGQIFDKLAHVLQMDEQTLLLLTLPEPLSLDGGGRLDDGPERDAGLAKLQDACRQAGMEPWKAGPVWWRSGPGGEVGPLGE